MTLPFGATLQKMWLPPYYLLFKVTIDGTQYLGRVDTLRYEQHFNKPSIGIFKSYKSIEDFRIGAVDKEIKTSSDKVEILEVIDSCSEQHPSAINSLITVCQKVIDTPNNADIGTVRRTLPDTLDELNYCVVDFCSLHKTAIKGDISEYIEETKKEIKKIPDNFSLDHQKILIEDLKERIFYLVDNLIRYSEHD